MATKTKNIYISATMTNTIKISTANLGFSTVASSKKVLSRECNNAVWPQSETIAPKQLCGHFWLSVVDTVYFNVCCCCVCVCVCYNTDSMCQSCVYIHYQISELIRYIALCSLSTVCLHGFIHCQIS